MAGILRDRVAAALALLLGVGLVLRVWFLLVWSPAITGYSDSGIYFQGSVSSLWSDPIRTVGYSMFLRVLDGYPDAALRLREHIASRADQWGRELENVRAALGQGEIKRP